jgi:hypothetical protein
MQFIRWKPQTSIRLYGGGLHILSFNIKPMRHCPEPDSGVLLGGRPCQNEVEIENDDGAVLWPI